MIDLRRLEKNEILQENQVGYLDDYREGFKNRGGDLSLVDRLLEINNRRKKSLTEFESRKAQQNKVGQEIAKIKRSGGEATTLLAEMQDLSQQLKHLEAEAQEMDQLLRTELMSLPNRIHKSVPRGRSEEDNRVERTWGDIPKFNFVPKDHSDIGEKLRILDFDRAAKVAGARFTFLRGAGAQLERALIQFMLDTHSRDHGYEEMIPPYIVNSSSLEGTGQFPKFKEDVFHLENSDYYLIPTAEVPVTNFYQNEILKETDLPKHFVAYSPCFRSEAGSYGRDTKGLIRQHQFHKVELLKFCHPDNSYKELETMVANAERILQLLKLPYRVVSLCSGDIGFAAAKCYDLEVWLPGQQKYREISSCSNCEDFQARRANIRFRPEGLQAKPQFVHTLNGSGLAVGRTLIAILENYQQENGSVKIPEVLKPYMGQKEYIG
jgi:seryl-tRNA synthetase